MKSKLIAALLLFVPLLAACGDDVKSVEYWMEHTEERKEKLQECEEKGELSVNCENASSADFNVRATGGTGKRESNLRLQ
ncbi:EexN family lipoprotein [Halomonas sp. AOP1-B1-8]|uniref:EexN family lipoprotein n=1 Tax=Halomonas sp. AOP1-B1-8 TaxID=3457726 RepID=UPI003FD9BCC0